MQFREALVILFLCLDRERDDCVLQNVLALEPEVLDGASLD